MHRSVCHQSRFNMIHFQCFSTMPGTIRTNNLRDDGGFSFFLEENYPKAQKTKSEKLKC